MIEDPQERAEFLKRALDLCEHLMVVSALGSMDTALGIDPQLLLAGMPTKS